MANPRRLRTLRGQVIPDNRRSDANMSTPYNPAQLNGFGGGAAQNAFNAKRLIAPRPPMAQTGGAGGYNPAQFGGMGYGAPGGAGAGPMPAASGGPFSPGSMPPPQRIDSGTYENGVFVPGGGVAGGGQAPLGPSPLSQSNLSDFMNMVRGDWQNSPNSQKSLLPPTQFGPPPKPKRTVATGFF